VFGGEILDHHKQRLRAEWCPQSPTEELLVAELARHAVALDLVAAAEHAVLRSGARGVMSMVLDADPTTDEGRDTVLAGAVTTDAIDRVTRYRRAHEKAWHAALQRLRELRAQDTPTSMSPPVLLPEVRFASGVFRQSTAYEFQVPCSACHERGLLDERPAAVGGPWPARWKTCRRSSAARW
jgi:hypothetical protein